MIWCATDAPSTGTNKAWCAGAALFAVCVVFFCCVVASCGCCVVFFVVVCVVVELCVELLISLRPYVELHHSLTYTLTHATVLRRTQERHELQSGAGGRADEQITRVSEEQAFPPQPLVVAVRAVRSQVSE